MKRYLVLAILLALATPGGAQDESGERLHNQRNPFSLMVRFLELDDAQVEAWQILIEEQKAGAADLRAQAREIQEQLKAEFESGDPSVETVGTLVIERRAVGEQLAGLQRDYVERFRIEILSEDQNQRLSFLRRAERAQPFVHAAKRLGLLPKAPPGEPDGSPGEGDADTAAPSSLPDLF